MKTELLAHPSVRNNHLSGNETSYIDYSIFHNGIQDQVIETETEHYYPAETAMRENTVYNLAHTASESFKQVVKLAVDSANSHKVMTVIGAATIVTAGLIINHVTHNRTPHPTPSSV